MAIYWPGGRGYGDSAEVPELGSYDSNHLLDSILDKLHLRDDVALCKALDVDESVVTELRELKREVDAALLIRMHELTDISIAGLRNILGDRRRKSRFALEAEQPAPTEGGIKKQRTDTGFQAAQPREVSRLDMDRQQAAHSDPDGPVSS